MVEERGFNPKGTKFLISGAVGPGTFGRGRKVFLISWWCGGGGAISNPWSRDGYVRIFRQFLLPESIQKILFQIFTKKGKS